MHVSNLHHHSQTDNQNRNFQKNVENLVATISEMGNPFIDNFPDLIRLDTRDCVPKKSVQNLRNLEEKGKSQCADYIHKVLVTRESSITEPIKKNNLQIFKLQSKKVVSAQGSKIKMLQNNSEIFSQSYIAMQNRTGDLDVFFSHEMQSFPPSLSDLGNMYLPQQKSDLLDCLIGPQDDNEECSLRQINSQCMIADGGAVVHGLNTKKVSTFKELAETVFVPQLLRWLKSYNAVHIVWDSYFEDSIKNATRLKRGTGVRRKVAESTKLPLNFRDFLRDPENKMELFQFLNASVSQALIPVGKTIVLTDLENVLSFGETFSLPPCNHEEADTRIMVHLAQSLRDGMTKFVIKTSDSDVVAILTSLYHQLAAEYPGLDIWVAFGFAAQFRYIHINRICARLGPQIAKCVAVFHSFTGSDTTSQFRGKGKKTAWKIWRSFEEVTAAFDHIVENPFFHLDGSSDVFRLLERYIVLLYDKNCPETSVNAARKYLVAQKQKSMDSLPPTQNALQHHFDRCIFQVIIIFGSR